jgi:hypothetical protein
VKKLSSEKIAIKRMEIKFNMKQIWGRNYI